MSGKCYVCVPYTLARHFHKEIVDVVVWQPTSHHNFWAIEQLSEVTGGHKVHYVVRIQQVNFQQHRGGHFLIKTLEY